MYEFVELLEQTATLESTTIDSSDLLQQLGDLMNSSMASSQTDADCSCPELDELTDLAKKSGAIGSRITGQLGHHCA